MDQAESIYAEKVTLEEVREVEEIEEPGGRTPKTLGEKSDEISELTDMQTAIKQLFPGGLGSDIYNALMIARIAPDVFIPLLRLIVVSEVMRSPADKPINVVDIMSKIYTLLSIGLDGKGRIDHIELAGASKDTEELEGLGKRLFGA